MATIGAIDVHFFHHHHHLFKSGNMGHTISINKRHTHIQTDRVKEEKKRMMYNKTTHKNADGQTQRSNFTISLLCLLQTHISFFLYCFNFTIALSDAPTLGLSD